MTDQRPPLLVKIQASESVVRQEAIKGVISLVVVVAIVGVQWWSITPAAERRVKLAKLGITRCGQGRWHFRQAGISLPRRCLCLWDGSGSQTK